MKRIFLAIDVELGEAHVSCIRKIKSELEAERIRWVKGENHHLTLHFFGDTDVEAEAKLIELLNEFVQAERALSFSLGQLAFFKKGKALQVLFIDVLHADRLKELAAKLQVLIVESGFAKPEKSFRAHLTIARMKNIANKERLGAVVQKYRECPEQVVQVNRIVLYESILKPEGPEYKPIRFFNLRE